MRHPLHWCATRATRRLVPSLLAAATGLGLAAGVAAEPASAPPNVPAPSVPAQPAPASSSKSAPAELKPVSLHFADAISIDDLLKLLGQQTGLQIIVSNAQDLHSKLITVNVDQQPPAQVLKAICKQADINCEFDSESNTWFVNREVLRLPDAPGGAAPGDAVDVAPSVQRPSTERTASSPSSGVAIDQVPDVAPPTVQPAPPSNTVERMIHLRYADCQQVVRMLESTDSSAFLDPLSLYPWESTPRSPFPVGTGAPINSTTIATLNDGSSTVLGHVLSQDLRNRLGGTVYAGLGDIPGLPASGSGALHRSIRSGDGFAQFPGGGYGGGGYGGGGYGGGRFGGGGFNQAGGGFNPGGGFNQTGANGVNGVGGVNGQNQVAFGGPGFSVLLPGAVNPNPTGVQLIPFPPSDSIIAIGPPTAIDAVEGLVRQLDIKPQLILIQVVKLVLSETDGRSLGFDYHLATPLATIDTNTGGEGQSGTISIRYLGNNLAATLAAAEQSGRSRIVETPRLIVPNGVLSSVNNTTQSYIIVPGQSGTLGSPTVPPQLIPVNSGFNFWIIPRLNRDGTVTLVSVIQDSTQSPPTVVGGTQVPGAIQSVTIPVPGLRVVNGDTIALGGFNSQQISHGNSRIPILGDLPIIGKLFQTTTDSDTRNVTLYFITPNLVDEHGQIVPGGERAVVDALNEADQGSAGGPITGSGGLPGPGGLPPVTGALPPPVAIPGGI